MTTPAIPTRTTTPAATAGITGSRATGTQTTETPDTTCALVLEVRDTPGVLVRTAQIFARRGCNITKIHVEHPAGSPWSHMTLVAGGVSDVGQIIRHLEKLIDVKSVRSLEPTTGELVHE